MDDESSLFALCVVGTSIKRTDSIAWSDGICGANDPYEKSVIEKALKRTFSPEFLNRIDDVMLFNSLKKDDIHKIIDIMLKNVYARLEALGYKVNLTKATKDFLVEKGYDPNYGARPLHHAIQKYVEDPLAEEILNTKPKEGDVYHVDYDKKESKLKITLKSGKKTEEKSDASKA